MNVNGALGDTWEYDGGAWVQRMFATTPPAGPNSAMAFDDVHNKVVLWCGADSSTWTYDGTAWTPVTTTNPPPGRTGAAIAWDSGRARAILFGGVIGTTTVNETWELDTTNKSWSKITVAPGTGPIKRSGANMAYLPSHAKVVMFGGKNLDGTVTLADTWEYDATGWSVYSGPTVPPGRYNGTLTYDPMHDSLVLVGGASGGETTPLTDVWEYKVVATVAGWVEFSPKFPRERSTMLAYDSVYGEAMAFAGDMPPLVAADTWGFDGTRWAELGDVTASPPWRRYHGLTFDSQRKTVVMFGGDLDPGVTNDTYEWTTASRTWTLVSAATKPPARSFPAMAYDPEAGVSVVAGGQGPSGDFTDTWEYNGTTWTQTVTSGAIKPAYQAMAYDPTRHGILALNNQDTWLYANHTWSQITTALVAPNPRSTNLIFDPERGRPVIYAATGYLWELQDDGWHEVTLIGDSPIGRFEPGFVAHHGARSLLLFGGDAGGGVLGDTYTFQYKSTTPDEDCTNGIDDDGDRQVDGADPDCMP
jgi:hypothetical protein